MTIPKVRNPARAIRRKNRFTGYVLYGLGSVVVTYLAARSIIGPAEVAAWSGIGAVFGFVAASNTTGAE